MTGLDLFEAVLALEQAFDVRLAERELRGLSTVGDLRDALLAAIRARHPQRFDSDPAYADRAWEQLRGLLTEQWRVKPDEITLGARFEDLETA